MQVSINNHVENLVKHFLQRVPTHLRDPFLKEQKRLIELAKDKVAAPRAQMASAIVDNRDVTGGIYKEHVYRVWIHAIWLKKDEDSERLAAFVMFFPFMLGEEEILRSGL